MSNTRNSEKKYYSLRSFFSYIGRYKLRFGFVMLFFGVSDLLLAIIPIFIGRLVGALASSPIHGHQAVIYVWILIACSTGHNLIWRVSEMLYLRYLRPLSFLYENILFKRVIHMPYPYFVDKFTGKMSSYITTVSQELRDFIESMCYNYVNLFVTLITITAIFSSINWQTAMIFLLGIVGMVIVGRRTISKSAHYEKIFADVQSTKNARLIDIIANFVNVKSFQKEDVETVSIEGEQDKTIIAAKHSFNWSLVFWGSMSFFVRDLIWPATIGFNVYLFLHHQISITQLTILLSTILLFSSTIWEIIWHVSQFNLKLARIDEAHVYLFGPTNIIRSLQLDHVANKLNRQLKDELKLNNLHFAYPDKPGADVLRGINLELHQGEKIGIVGKSGSGKTTLTKLLLGYYTVNGGEILVDSDPIDTRDLAQMISYVPQDTSLFHRTVADNISYATDVEVSKSDIIEAAKQAHAHEFITQIGDGYEALVGERGVKLSAGQRQRIAIARAFLDDKPILILDEATSALDSESEMLIQEALEALWKNKTVIAIAHRLSTLRHMDTILVMDKGQILERGSHAELLKKDGLYAKLWSHQSGGFMEE